MLHSGKWTKVSPFDMHMETVSMETESLAGEKLSTPLHIIIECHQWFIATENIPD